MIRLLKTRISYFKFAGKNNLSLEVLASQKAPFEKQKIVLTSEHRRKHAVKLEALKINIYIVQEEMCIIILHSLDHHIYLERDG